MLAANPDWSCLISHHLQSLHRAGAGSESVRFNAEPLQHADEEVRQRIVALAVESEVLALFEAAAGEESGKVRGDVRVRIAEVRAVQRHRAVEQRVDAFMTGLQFGEEMIEQLHMRLINHFKLPKLIRRFSMVR